MAHTEYPDPDSIPSDNARDIDAETAALMRDLLSSVGEPDLVSAPSAESVIDPDPVWEPDAPLAPADTPPTDDPILASLPPVDPSDPEPIPVPVVDEAAEEPRTVGDAEIPDLRSAAFDDEKSPPRPVVFPGVPTTIDEAVDFEYATAKRMGRFPNLPLVLLGVLGLALAAATYWALSREAGGARLGGYDAYTTSLYGIAALAVLGLVLLIPVWLVARKRMPREKGVFGQALLRIVLVIALAAGLWFLAVTAGQTWPMVTP